MIPNDPVMLLSYVNTQLRDYYSSLDALCEDKGIGKEELVEKMKSIEYVYEVRWPPAPPLPWTPTRTAKWY